MLTMEKPQDGNEQIVPGKGMIFSFFLTTLQNGDYHAALTEDLHEMAAAINQHFQDFRGSPKGEINLKIKFEFDPKLGVVEVLASKKVKLPEKPEAGALLFVDAANNFVQDDPRQMNMGFPRSGPRAVK